MKHHTEEDPGHAPIAAFLDDGWIRALVLIATLLVLYGWLRA